MDKDKRNREENSYLRKVDMEKMLRVSWTEKKTNESIMMVIGHAGGDNFVAETKGSKTEVDVLCDESKIYGREKDMMLAYGEGRRKRGHPMKRWMEEILTTSRMNLAELKDAVADRDLRRK